MSRSFAGAHGGCFRSPYVRYFRFPLIRRLGNEKRYMAVASPNAAPILRGGPPNQDVVAALMAGLFRLDI